MAAKGRATHSHTHVCVLVCDCVIRYFSDLCHSACKSIKCAAATAASRTRRYPSKKKLPLLICNGITNTLQFHLWRFTHKHTAEKEEDGWVVWRDESSESAYQSQINEMWVPHSFRSSDRKKNSKLTVCHFAGKAGKVSWSGEEVGKYEISPWKCRPTKLHTIHHISFGRVDPGLRVQSPPYSLLPKTYISFLFLYRLRIRISVRLLFLFQFWGPGKLVLARV